MNFEFATASRIIFGPGSAARIGSFAAGFGKKALVCYGVPADILFDFVDALTKGGIAALPFLVQGEPTIELIENGTTLARQAGCDQVVGLGGGSAIDTGKAIAALLTNPGELSDFLEVIGKGQVLQQTGLPFIAVPTTAGTGAEVTQNAVLSAAVPDQPLIKVKVSLRSPSMLARLAIVDPELTLGLPAAVTASTGLDALTQLIEPFVSIKSNPLVDALCREGMRFAARSLRRAYTSGSDLDARQDMCLASLMGGLALANAKLGAVHGFAAPIGGRFPAPHGMICARLLPVVTRINLRALQEREPHNQVRERYQEISRILTGIPTADAEDGLRWIEDLVKDLQVPGLSTYGLEATDYSELAELASRASSMQGNPIKLTNAE
jgi:alcohol dehydrogenase class IV